MNFKNRIDEYLLGEMEGEEKSIFESEMDKDIEFSKEVEFHQKIMEASSANSQLRERIAELGKENPNAMVKKPFKISYLIGIAALLFLLIGMSYYFFFSNGNTEQPVFAEIAGTQIEKIEAPYIDVLRGSTTTPKKELKKLLDNNEYDTALKKIGNIENLSSTKRQIIKGFCLSKIGKEDQARIEFRNVFNNSESQLTDKWYAGYYMSLILLKNEKRAEAKTIIDKIIHDFEQHEDEVSDFDYEKETRDLKSKLDKE